MKETIFESRMTRDRLDELLDEHGWKGTAQLHPNYDNLRPFWNNQDDSAICEYVCEIFNTKYEEAPEAINMVIQNIEMDFVLRGKHWTTQASDEDVFIDLPDED